MKYYSTFIVYRQRLTFEKYAYRENTPLIYVIVLSETRFVLVSLRTWVDRYIPDIIHLNLQF